MVSRDEIKEGMVHAQGGEFRAEPGDPLTQRTFTVFFEVLKLLLVSNVSLVAEAAFQDKVWRIGLEALTGLADVRVVHCSVDLAIARERMARRLATDPSRRAHADATLLGGAVAGGSLAFEPLSMSPSLVVDTTDGYLPDLASIVAFVQRP